MPNPYLDEFKKNYERPQIDGLIVGFSGIDPQKKNETVALSDEQQNIIRQLVLSELSDNSGCQCDQSNLSDEQKDLVDNIIDNRLQQLFFHYNGGEIIGDDFIPDDVDDDSGSSDNSDSNDNSGGNGGSQTIIVDNPVYDFPATNVISEINPALIDHEKINGLLGGTDNAHFHLSHDELKCLRLIIAAFFPYINNDSPDSSDNNDDPYTIVMPPSVITPVTPVTPVSPDDDIPTSQDDLNNYDPHYGMPSGTPPTWDILSFPSGYTAYPASHKMYYGPTPTNPSKNVLVAYVYKNARYDYAEAVITSSDAKSWVTNNSEKIPYTSHMGSSDNSYNFYDYFFDVNNSCLYVLFSPDSQSSSSINYNLRCRWPANSYTKKVLDEANSMCWAPQLQALLVAAKDGNTTLMKFKTASTKYVTPTSIFNAGMPVNPSSAAFHPNNQVLCLCGPKGTAVSSDGVSWFVNPDAPKNMTDLFYREDLDAFFARSLDDNLFYFSHDGGNWSKAGNAPIPLENITAVDFNPVNKVFCAVGLGDKGAYFSKDLNHWTFIKIRNTTTDIASVISLHDKGLYVAMPTAGTYYYTFNYNAWNNVSDD